MNLNASLTFLYAIIVIMTTQEPFTNALSLDSTKIDRNMMRKYDQLASTLLQRITNTNTPDNQYWVGIAGPPGAGKSTLSAAVSQRLNELAQTEVSIVLPMDGYHYTRAQLRAMGEADGAQYTYEQLLARRGAPWTFDPKV